MNLTRKQLWMTCLAVACCPALVQAKDVGKPTPCTSQETQSGRVTIPTSFSGNHVAVPVKTCITPGTVLNWTAANEQEDFEASFHDQDHCPFKPGSTGQKQLNHTKATPPGPVDCKRSDRNFDPALNGCWSRYKFHYKTSDGKSHPADPDIIVSPPSE